MTLEGAMEVYRIDQWAVLDRGVPTSRREREEDRPRYAVVEYDDKGPIMRAGPFRVLRIAVEECMLRAFKADLPIPKEGKRHASKG